MPDDRPYIEIEFTGTTLTQIVSDTTLIGTDIVIDYGDGTIINYTGNYSHTYNESGSYTIRIYGVTSLGNNCFYNCSDLTSVIIPNSVTSIGYSCFRGCHGLTSIIIPSSVTSLGNYCFRTCNSLISVIISESVKSIGHYCFNYCPNLTNIQLKWASSVDILTYNSNWINDATNSNLVFIIPQGTTSLYEAKGYPTAKLVERIPNVSSYELFSDVKRLFLNNKEVKSIVIDETDGGIIYERTTTPIILSGPSEIDYGQNVILNGSIPFDTNSIKIYQNDVLIGTTLTSNGIFSYTISNLNAGTYTFKAVFEGDEDHVEGESNGVIVTVNKATIVLTLSSDKSVIHYNETVTLSGTTTVDGTIKIWQGGELSPLTSIESVNGTFSYTFTIKRQGTIQVFATIDATDNYNLASSNIVTLTYSNSTNLTIEVPTLIYSDIFDVTGILTDEDNNPIPNASIKLYRDTSILEATETTNNNGEVTFHRSAPTSITTYTFQLVFDGDSSYSNSSSSVVTRKVNAETTILNLTSPLNNATYNEGETIPIAGTITTDDGEQLSSENPLIVTVYDENNNRLTVLPIVNGAFSRNITAPSSVGNHSITVKFEGITTIEEPQEPQLIYAPSEATVNITVNAISLTPLSLTLNSNRNTLSYLHNESATLTATVLDENDNPCVDELVVFNVDGTIINAQTNNNGVATTTYNSNNGGEIYVTATCENLQDNTTINDIYYYNSGAELSKMSDFNVSGRWSAKNTSAGNVTCTTDETEWLNITASGLSDYGHIPITPLIGLNQPFKLSCIIKDANRDDRGSGGTYVSTYNGFYACRSTGGYGILLQWYPFRIPRSDKGSRDNWSIKSSAQNPSNGTYKYEVTFNGSSITHKLYYLDGSVYKTASVSISDLNNANYSIEYGISYDNQRSFDIKDIKAELM